MKIQSKSPFLKFSDTISLLNPNKLIKRKEMSCEQKTSADPVGTYYKIMRALEDKMSAWERASVERAQAKISQVPTFHKVPIVQALDNLEMFREVFQGMSDNLKESLKARAIKFGISYDEENTNYEELLGDVERHERYLEIQTSKLLEAQAKADKYNIPYNKRNIDVVKLTDDVEEWEGLLSEAKELNLKVDPSYYDRWAVRDLIEEELSQGRREMRDQYLDYCSSRL